MNSNPNNATAANTGKTDTQRKEAGIDPTLASGISAATGAVVGVVAGTVVATPAQAAEIEAEPEHEPMVTPIEHPTFEHEPQPEPEPVPEPTPRPQPEPEPEPQPEPEPEPQPEPEPEPQPEPEPIPEPDPIPGPEPEPDGGYNVIGYNVVQDEDGTEGAIATLEHNGELIFIADTDNDGYANIMAHDINDNGQFDPGEVVDITEDHLAMAPLQQAYEEGLLAQEEIDNGPDYINDGNVDDYMA